MHRYALFWLFLTLLPALPTRAAALPDVPALATPVTLETRWSSLGQILADLSKQVGVPLTVDLPASAVVWLTVGARDCPARDLMAAIAAQVELEWEPEAGGGFRLRCPVIEPPAMETAGLIAKLAAACPAPLRPTQGGPAPTARAGLGDALIAAFRAPLLQRLEMGEDVPFTDLPAGAQRAISEYRRGQDRQAIAQALRPTWNVPPDSLGVSPAAAGDDADPRWTVAVRDASARGRLGSGLGASVPGWFPTAAPGRRDGEAVVADKALDVARRLRVGVVVGTGGATPAQEARGDTPEDALASLLGKDARMAYAWEPSGRAYRLTTKLRRPASSPELDRCRQLLEGALPAEYHPLFLMTAYQRRLALFGPWIRLRRSFAAERRNVETLLAVSELSREQQAWVYAGLQAQMTAGFWSALSAALPSRPDDSRVRLDLDDTGNSRGPFGFVPTLDIRDDDGRVVFRGPFGPAMLQALPSGDEALGRSLNLAANDESLADVAARLSDAWGAPVVAAEPARETRLTAGFREKPARAVLNWLERRTGLQWQKRGSIYVLAPSVSATVAADPARALEVLHEALPSPSTEYPSWKEAVFAVRGAVAPKDRAVLAAGTATLTQLSPGLQRAIRDLVLSRIGNPVGAAVRRVRLASALAAAEMVVTQPLRQVPVGQPFMVLRLGVPGGPSEELRVTYR